MSIHLRWLLAIASLCCSCAVFFLYKEIRHLKKTVLPYNTIVSKIDNAHWGLLPLAPGEVILPLELQNIPLGEKTGVVVGTKQLHIRNVLAPYNPSMIENSRGYLLFFRYDVITQDCNAGFYSYIGSVQLDRNFDQIEEYKEIDTGSKFSEDPRIVKTGDELHMFFNDLHPCGGKNGRTMRVAKIDPKEMKLDYITNLDLQFQRIEKNWVPFEYVKDNKPELYIEYYMNPHKILRLGDPQVSFLDHLSFPGSSASQRLYWPKIWGIPRGGATARKIGNQYVSFFHSSFVDRRGSYWYLMGAYTFEETAPFRITNISNYPILFKGIYNTPLTNTAIDRKQVIFPSGFCMEEKEGKQLIHVACGENDCAIKIVTIDQTELLKSMKPI